MIRMLAVLLLLASGARAADLYVNSSTGHAGATGSARDPFLTIWQAGVAAKPCDTVHVTGTFASQSVLRLHGNAACWITFVGEGARLIPSAPGVKILHLFDVSYIRVRGFQVAGVRGPEIGIFVSSPDYSINDRSRVSHHIEILNNEVWNCGGDGIAWFQTDHMLVRGNRVHDNASYTRNGVWSSGIVSLAPVDSDPGTGDKIVIDGNYVWNNTNTPNCDAADAACLSKAFNSDGNGIILDTGKYTYVYSKGASPGKQQPSYGGTQVIQNNVAWFNGGRGVHLWQVSHVRVVNNSLFHNNRDPWQAGYRAGELSIDHSSDVVIANNIMVATGGRSNIYSDAPNSGISIWESSSDVRLVNNWTQADTFPSRDQVNFVWPAGWGGVTPTGITWSRTTYALPGFTRRPTASGSQAPDFSPMPNAPIANQADPAYSPTYDIDGALRGGKSAVGAYAR